jgi:hypothetical protein
VTASPGEPFELFLALAAPRLSAARLGWISSATSGPGSSPRR